MAQVMSGDDIKRAIRRIAHEIHESHTSLAPILVGVHTRGVTLSRRIGDALSSISGSTVLLGELDVGLYRDDRRFRDDIPVRATNLPVDIDGRPVVVVDDVLYTGRTVRACLDALTDLGRSSSTSLAVLVDRGHRELPIRADYVGKNLPTARDQVVFVRLAEDDGQDGVFVERTEAA